MRRSLLVAAMLFPALATAQGARFELTPTVGYRFGGEMFLQERAIRHQDFDVGISSSGAWGIRFGLAAGQAAQVEVLISHQSTTFKDNQGLFGETPGGFVVPGDTHVLDMDVTYYHVGLAWHTNSGPTRGFLAASAGATRLVPRLPLPNDTRPSASVGGGIKLDFNDKLAARFEGRYYWTDTDPKTRATYTFANLDCTGPCSYTYAYPNSMSQFEVTFGLAFRF